MDATTSTAFIIFPMSLFSEPIDDPKVVFPGLFDSYAKGAGFEAHQCQLCQKKLSSANSEDTDALNLLQQNCYQLQWFSHKLHNIWCFPKAFGIEFY